MDSVSVVSAAVAVIGAVLTGFFGYWQQRRLHARTERNFMERYRSSLALAAYDLQSRLYNVLRGHVIDQTSAVGHAGYLTLFLSHGTPAEAAYARRSTVFVLAEYLGWAEILRRDIQFLNLGRSHTNRKIMRKLGQVGELVGRVSQTGNELRVFRAHQRAIGELMVHPDSVPGQRWCLGYAEFCRRLDHDEGFVPWFAHLLDDVDRLAVDPAPAMARLQALQNALVELIDLLDPAAVQLPRNRRKFDLATQLIDAQNQP
ncbi:hypothetical protein [Streptomyces zagrosensis]|uniref:Uncharacterized protein n=1 Tax=Streptomyces zagrosensis TaxID=1042984 RepID=A0A7W9QDI7_9ACTN|nr:hypothetical protein [Streptomyces zagrosensis]MBB5937974.1 hypothetical protein [Streptomyces zagrosensis]